LNKIKLDKIKKMSKIGSFKVTDTVVMGDKDFDKVKLRKGIYDAYKVNDNLMIVHKSYKGKVNKTNIKNWVWHYCKKSVKSTNGLVGFYDLNIVNRVNKLKLKNKNKKIALNVVRKAMSQLPKIKKEFVKYVPFIVTGETVTNNEELNDVKFGVISNTGTGKGSYDCYSIGSNRAIILGGLTQFKLYD